MHGAVLVKQRKAEGRSKRLATPDIRIWGRKLRQSVSVLPSCTRHCAAAGMMSSLAVLPEGVRTAIAF